MAESQHVVYWRGGEDTAGIVQALRNLGYSVVSLSTIDELYEASTRFELKLVIVDASNSDAEAANRVVELTGAVEFVTIPIVFISYQAEKRSAVLKRQFKQFVPVDVPFRLSSIIEAVTKFLGTSGVQLDGSAEKVPTEKFPAAESAAKRVGKTSAIEYRNKLVQNLDPANLISSYGGELLATANSASSFDDSLLVPNHPKRESLLSALASIAAANKWLGMHTRRVTFISSAIANALSFGRERDVRIRVSALTLNWGMRNGYQSVASFDPLLEITDHEKILKMLIRGFHESADYLKKEIQDEDAANVVQTLCSFIVGDPVQAEESIILDAQCLLATELADRASWSSDTWDPFGAHRTIRKIRQGHPITFNSDIVDRICRILSEAAASRQSIATLMVPSDNTGGDVEADVTSAVEESKKLFGNKEQLNLQIADLKPGMVLARPIISWDGKLVLRSNIELTDDLVWRLWQLATIRPLRPPVSVVAQKLR